MTLTKYFVEEEKQALFRQISLFSQKNLSILTTNLPNWIISRPDRSDGGTVKIFPQNRPDEDQCDNQSMNAQKIRVLAKMLFFYPKSTRNIHRALSIQCLPSSVMYLSPWPLEASQYSFSCNESLIEELGTDVFKFLPVENILCSFSPRPSMTFFSDPSMILFLSSLAFCATSSCCFRQSWHAWYHCCSNCPFPGLIDK